MKINDLKEVLGVEPTSNVYKPTTNDEFTNLLNKNNEDDSDDFKEIFDKELDKKEERIVMTKRK